MGRTVKTGDAIALFVVALIGIPFLYSFSAAFMDGEVRRSEAPFRSLFGNATYEALREGREVPQHYLGEDRRLPDFELPMRDGGTFRAADARGKVLVMNFWTVTCAPCMEEMPSLLRLAEILEDRDDIELVTISVDQDWATVAQAVPEGSPMTVLLDADRSVVADRFGTRLFPETWVVDPNGVIRMRFDGRADWGGPIALEVFESFL
jgi:peroxiredoxin